MNAERFPNSHPFFDARFECRELIRFAGIDLAGVRQHTDGFKVNASIERFEAELDAVGRCDWTSEVVGGSLPDESW
jgi:hypothetical protein